MLLDAAVVAMEELEGLDAFVLAFAEDAATGEPALMLQVAYEVDDQDRALGMDTYSVSVDGATVYGGITRCRLSADALGLELSPEAARALGIDRSVVVRLRDAGVQQAELHAALARVFDPKLREAPRIERDGRGPAGG